MEQGALSHTRKRWRRGIPLPHQRFKGVTGVGGKEPAGLFTSMTNCTTRRGGPSLEGGWGRRFHSYGCPAASRGRPGGTTCYRAVSVLSRMDRFVFVHSRDTQAGLWTTAYRPPSPHRIKSEPLVDPLSCHRMVAGRREPGARFAHSRCRGQHVRLHASATYSLHRG